MFFPPVRYQVLQLYKTTGKIIVLYIWLHISGKKWEDKIFWTEMSQAFPQFSLFFTSSRIQFWFVPVVVKYLTLPHIHRICFLSWCYNSALSCILFMWYEHILSFLCIYFKIVSLPAKNTASAFFLVVCYVVNQQIIIISTCPKLICTIQFQTLLVCLNLHNGMGLLLGMFFFSLTFHSVKYNHDTK